MQSIQLIISGKVQGVGYRKWFYDEAEKRYLKVIVKNLFSGKVEAIILGDENNIAEMIKLSYGGPELADVTEVQQKVLAHNVSVQEYLEIDKNREFYCKTK